MGAPVGNQNAAKAKRWHDALCKALARYENAELRIKAGEALDAIAYVVVHEAATGNKDAWLEISNRLDGKVPQAIIGDDDSPPVTIKAMVELVRAP